jgi:hypothetical protein
LKRKVFISFPAAMWRSNSSFSLPTVDDGSPKKVMTATRIRAAPPRHEALGLGALAGAGSVEEVAVLMTTPRYRA